MAKNSLNILCYMIVIEDDEKSIFYKEHCTPSWVRAGIEVNVFSAITPNTLYKEKELTFAKHSSSLKYTRKNIKAEITQTEKACWYSHYKLWQECCFVNKPILILEHDSLLLEPEKLWKDSLYGIIFFDKAAMGSYILYPWFAKILVQSAINHIISTGPYAFIENIAMHNSILDKVVNCRHRLFNPAANQVYSSKYGNTIDHYSNNDLVNFGPEHQHQFVLI